MNPIDQVRAPRSFGSVTDRREQAASQSIEVTNGDSSDHSWDRRWNHNTENRAAPKCHKRIWISFEEAIGEGPGE